MNPNDLSLTLALAALVGFGAATVLELRDMLRGRGIQPRWLLLAFSAAFLLSSYLLTQTPAPVATQQEEPTPTGTPTSPWPTGTPDESGCSDFYDALCETDRQLQHYIDEQGLQIAAIQTFVWQPTMTAQPTATPYPTIIPTVMPTATPDPMCKACLVSSDCPSGLRCYKCSDKINRCVRSISPNGDCTNCRNAGR